MSADSHLYAECADPCSTEVACANTCSAETSDCSCSSYTSLYGQVRNARRSASGPAQFIREVFSILVVTLVGSICCTLLLGVFLLLPLAVMIIAIAHLGDCPAQPAIPLWLIVDGMMYFLCCAYRMCHQEKLSSLAIVVGSLFRLVWYILGCIWIHGIQYPSYNQLSSPEFYCNRTLYLTALVLLVLAHCILMMMMLIVCCFVGFFLAGAEGDDDDYCQQRARLVVQHGTDGYTSVQTRSHACDVDRRDGHTTIRYSSRQSEQSECCDP